MKRQAWKRQRLSPVVILQVSAFLFLCALLCPAVLLAEAGAGGEPLNIVDVAQVSDEAAPRAPVDEYGDVTKEGVETGEPPAGEYGDVTGEQAKEEEGVRIADPLERWNRAMFKVNDRLYFWVFRPVTRAYKRVVPEDFRGLFASFYKNLTSPIRIANNLFQFKLKYAGNEFVRTVVNTTAGVGGLRDIAGDCFAIRSHDEDFGQTLGFYGAGFGFYLVWPVLGPSSARDSVGIVADWYLYPVSYLDPLYVRYGMAAHDRVNDLSFHLGEYEALKKAAIDPYVAMRSAYAQYRTAAVRE